MVKMKEKVLAECIAEALIKSKLHLVEHDMLKEYITAYKENQHLQDLQKNMDKQYAELENNWNKLKEHFKKQTIDLEIKREDISADTYVDRKMFLKEVLSKMEEIERGKDA